MAKRIPSAVTPQDMRLLHSRCHKFLATPQAFPLSYTYNGSRRQGLPAGSTTTRRLLDANLVETVITGHHTPELTVTVRVITYRDYPVMEWTVHFHGSGSSDTAILQDIWAIDATIGGENARLVHNNGDFYSAEGYTVAQTRLDSGADFTQAPVGGRPCDQAFPYQRLLFNGFGVALSIGWPGQWHCRYTGGRGQVRVRAGQQTVHTLLHPGETLRTPRMTLLFFQGEEKRGVNLWRRWFNAHVTPRRMGTMVQPAIAFMENAGGIEHLSATEENQVAAIRYLQEHIRGAGLWWIDAGWYTARTPQGKPEWPHTGTWEPDPQRFPRGLGPVGEACAEAGLDLLVWFEPERVRPGTWLAEHHPEWMLHDEAHPENYLLNLADPSCLEWLCKTVSRLIEESGIRCYRQDFNFEPLPYWRANEAADRKGMLENLYIQAYLRFWDTLLLEHPDLWIDSCASGGRRNDMETLRRSVPLHPTDYGYGYHHINQAFRHTLLSWIPYTRGFCQSWDRDNAYYSHDDYYAIDAPSLDNFKLVNSFAALTIVSHVRDLQALEPQLPYLNRMLEIANRFGPILLEGDFYPLTENHRDPCRWTVFQFDCPEAGAGAFQVLRNNRSPDASCTVFPDGLAPGASYRMTNPETGESRDFHSREVAEKGLTFSQPVRSGAIWFYGRLPQGQGNAGKRPAASSPR